MRTARRYAGSISGAFTIGIDRTNEWVGRIAAWLVIPLALLVAVDVALRYIFIRPIIWAWDVNIQLLGALAVLSGGYVLLNKGHVIVDALPSLWPPKVRAVVDMVTSALFFLAVGVLLWQMTSAAWSSIEVKELLPTYVEAPIYPLKALMVVGILLLLLQGIAKFIRDLNVATGK